MGAHPNRVWGSPPIKQEIGTIYIGQGLCPEKSEGLLSGATVPHDRLGVLSKDNLVCCSVFRNPFLRLLLRVSHV